MKDTINILIHPYYTEESSKFLDVYDEQLEKGKFNIIFYPQVGKKLKKVIIKKHLKEFKDAFINIKNKSDLDKVYNKENIHKHLFHLHHTARVLREIYFTNFFRYSNRKNKTIKAKKLKRKKSDWHLNKFIHKIECYRPILRLSKNVAIFKDDVIHNFSLEGRKYLENKFKDKKITVHLDGGSFISVDMYIKLFKKILNEDIENYDIKIFGEYRNLCVMGLEDILKENNILDYEVIDKLCTFNATGGKVLDKEGYFYIKQDKGENNGSR